MYQSMMRLIRFVILFLLFIVSPSQARQGGELFQRVTETLKDRFYDEDFRRTELVELIERYQESARRTRSLDSERRVVHELLSKIPASHLALMSMTEYQTLWRELTGKPYPTFGFELVEWDGEYFAHRPLDGGPAAKSGLLPGDRILTVNRVLTEESPLLDWRSDDAALPDPAVHRLLCEAGARVRLEIERTPGEHFEISITAVEYSALSAAKASARVINRDDTNIGYVHLWYIHISTIDKVLKQLLQRKFSRVDALIIDLRGRGGSADMVPRILKILSRWSHQGDRPVVALIDSMTRSAKEMIAYSMRNNDIAVLVGQRTAGALLPATFEQVGPETMLMFPSFDLGKYTKRIEGIGVEPHVKAQPPGPYSAGADPILEAGIEEAVRLSGKNEVTPESELLPMR